MFQYIGYFNRPLSTDLYVVFLVLLFAIWLFFLRLARKKMLSRKHVWILIGISAGILVFAYNAFSYDIFNYIFDAKIFTFYHQNPYLHKALDFPQDKMLNFMRWTHRTYPYGPFWLVLTVPLSFIGLQYFLPTFFLFKFLMAGSYLGTCYFIEKISKKLFPQQTLANVIFFALNPLVLIESLVSAHVDIVMMFFAMMAVWLLIEKKWRWSLLLLTLSAGVKFATGFLLPVFVYYFFILSYMKKSHGTFSGLLRLPAGREVVPPHNGEIWEVLFLISGVIMTMIVVLESHSSGNFQPWYVLIVLPFASLLSRKYYILIPTGIFCFFALLEYVPFLYLGNWNPPVPMILLSLTIAGIVLSVFGTIVYKLGFRV